MSVKEWFERFATWSIKQAGKAWAFIWSVVLVVVWAASGPMFGFNDTWQLIINTSTTVITFWMVFVIQHAQNKNETAISLKLDELLRVTEDTNEALIGAEDRNSEELEEMEEEGKNQTESG